MPDDDASSPLPSLPGVVVPASWLQAHRDGVVLADVRSYMDGRSGRQAHLDGHIPGAVFVELDTVLADPPSTAGGRHPFPSPEDFADRLGALGIGADDVVVAYDDTGGSTAARLVWMLRVLGQPAALLDGGLAAWDGPLETGPVNRPAVQHPVRAWPGDRLVDADDVGALAGPAGADAGAVVVDARVAGRYTGEAPLPIDPRPGHIPGARSLPWPGNLDESGRFLAPDALRARFARLGLDQATTVVAYCGSGVTACHDLLAMEHAGLSGGRLFPGSWSAWGADLSRANALGEEP